MSEFAELKASPLGKVSNYSAHYSPELLYPIARYLGRNEIGIQQSLPFHGYDTWNAYELTWLNLQGKPLVAIAQIDVPCESPNIFESKSLKLYLNSFSKIKFATQSAICNTILQDLTQITGAPVAVSLKSLDEFTNEPLQNFAGDCLDELDISIDNYQTNVNFLSVTGSEVIAETLFTNLLKSNCPVTGQPDFGSVQIQYRGAQIAKPGLLKYIISLRENNEFHEQCVERIFMDILQRCKPISLTVEARYTRRGGIDINPLRSTEIIKQVMNMRMARQ